MRISQAGKLAAWILVAASLLSLAAPVSAESTSESASTPPQKKMVLTVGSIRYSVTDPLTGQTAEKECDTRPAIVNDRTMVPVRVISEGLGFQVSWDGRTRTVTISSTTRVVAHQVGSNILRIEESGVSPREVVLDVRSYLNEDGRTMLPVRGITEALGCKVDWNPAAVPKGTLGRAISDIPKRFDLRDVTELTPVKEQGGTGGCWAFASIAALFDLSENHMMTQLSRAYDESFDRDSGSGGDDVRRRGTTRAGGARCWKRTILFPSPQSRRTWSSGLVLSLRGTSRKSSFSRREKAHWTTKTSSAG